MRNTYQVNEIFHSVQGEGIFTGKAATFIRLQGCTVGCPWCDSGPLADQLVRRSNGQTSNTWGRGGTRMTVSDIVQIVRAYWKVSDSPHIIITGGEPTLYDLDSLIIALRAMDTQWPFIQLETSGQNGLRGAEKVDWVTWSPKENLEYWAPRTLLQEVSEVKFVVDEKLEQIVVADTEALFLSELNRIPFMVLMPEGCPPSHANMRKAYEWALWHPNWRVMDRLQYRLEVR